jgi:hypothetical protein
LDGALDPKSTIYGLVLDIERAQTMAFALLKVAFVVNVVLVEADAFANFKTVDDFSSEFYFLELVLAQRSDDVDGGPDVDGLRRFFFFVL